MNAILALSWQEVFDFSKFTDGSVYAIMALTATILFVIKLAMALLGADTEFGDLDGDAAVGDFDHGSDASFSMFSLLSVLAFFMGTGWMGLACRIDWGLGSTLSATIAMIFGLFMMTLASAGMFFLRSLTNVPVIDMNECIGTTGRTYMRIPHRGEGEGKVELTVGGARKIMPAVSTGAAIESFTAVKVISVRDDHCLEVEPSS